MLSVRPIGWVRSTRSEVRDDDWDAEQMSVVLADEVPDEALSGLGGDERPDAREPDVRQPRGRDAHERVAHGVRRRLGRDGDRDVRVHVRGGVGDRLDAGGLEHREQARHLQCGGCVELELDRVRDAHRGSSK